MAPALGIHGGAQRDAFLAKVASQARSMLALFVDKGLEKRSLMKT
jgi:hypothetical protein